MKIKDIFTKPIDRNIKGVITIGDEQDANVKQELEEYVVTKELDGHFKDFFSAYAAGIQHDTTNVGVWISGFFGSGKSHFLKILAYLLENRRVADKSALDYFIDDQKIQDPATLADMKLATTVPNEVMLFNIDSKAKNGNKSQKDAILNVFLQVFNEQLGLFGADFWIADLERDLIAQGQYESFQTKFEELDKQHRQWQDARNAYAFLKGTIRDTLVAIDFMSESDANGFIDQLKKEYPVSVEGFAKLVNAYIEQQPQNYHMVFLVDEVGQYIGSSQQRMLNLQSIVEDLGTYTHGKAWVIVTSQQAIDKVTKNINGQDFSKIQGRFKTRIAMSSANVDEVIQKRLLSKTSESEQILTDVFNNKQHVINNLISFDGKEERKRYDNATVFADLYPFVPYQIFLLQDTLTAIRENGSDGKHLANGERSMLAVFQEAARRLEDRDINTLVPFSIFFQGLSHFLDHTHMIVIQRAKNNELINPNGEENPFNVQVLETLFMVKYVSDFDATLNNLVTLMIDSIDTDRIELEKKVKQALRILQEQNVVEKTSRGYEFLTDAEQDISKQIQRQNVDSGDISQAIGEYLFSSVAISRRYTYPQLKQQYTFVFNQWVDDRPIGQTNNDVNLKLVTAESSDNRDDIELQRQSNSPEQPQIVIDLPSDEQYVLDQQQVLKVQKFILDPHEQAQDARTQRIIDLKKTELVTLKKRLAQELLDVLQEAKIYVLGDIIEAGKKDFHVNLAQAQERLIDEIYRNLSYIDVVMQDSDVVALFKDTDELVKTSENERAIQAVLERISHEFERNGHNKISYRSMLDRFKQKPYGYRDIDTKWMLAKLFADSKLKVYVNGEGLSLHADLPANTLANYFLKRQYVDAVQVEPRQAISEQKKRDLRIVAKDVFGKQSFSDAEDDTLVTELRTSLVNEQTTLDKYLRKESFYPGQDILKDGSNLIQSLLAKKDTDKFFDQISLKKDELLDWREDMTEFGISEFYKTSAQQEIWESANKLCKIYENSSEFVRDNQVKDYFDQIEKIMKNHPQGKIKALNDLIRNFRTVYMQEFDTDLEGVQQRITAEQMAAVNYSASQGVEADYKDEIEKKFDELKNNARNAKTLNALFVIPEQAKTRREKITMLIDSNLRAAELKKQRQNERLREVEDDKDETTDIGKTTSDDSAEKVVEEQQLVQPIFVSIKTLPISQTWQLDSAEDVEVQVQRLQQVLMNQLQEKGSIKFEL
ncbi:BREX system P-loop protein BrxC [Levilactobacillus brevis]|uniref:BREX system P-loop protein BrxC n=1 Tax=Levilactobacillus brevis TaxID=1580 RepID=UPI000B3FA48B|nr:BREX system P-loop protein BrxC [Levilactobacillus brevis]